MQWLLSRCLILIGLGLLTTAHGTNRPQECFFDFYPLEIKHQILYNIPNIETIKAGRRVCKEWRYILTSHPKCSWQIEVRPHFDRLRHLPVVRLDLSSLPLLNGITFKPQDTLTASLKYLDIDGLALTPEILKQMALGHLSRLCALNLYSCLDEQIINQQTTGQFNPHSFFSLIEHDRAVNDLIQYLNEHFSLNTLDLGGNRLPFEAYYLLGQHTSLTKLSLSHGEVADGALCMLENLPSLTYLNLSGNSISSAGADTLCTYPFLSKLRLDDNLLGDVGAFYISHHPTVTSLTLTHNEITDVGVQFLAGSTTLCHLVLGMNIIGPMGALHLSQNTTIKSLNLTANSLKDEGVKYLASNTTLVRLTLCLNQITDAGAKLLVTMKQLQHLNLLHNSISPPVLAHLTHEIPGLQKLNKNVLVRPPQKNLHQPRYPSLLQSSATFSA